MASSIAELAEKFGLIAEKLQDQLEDQLDRVLGDGAAEAGGGINTKEMVTLQGASAQYSVAITALSNSFKAITDGMQGMAQNMK